MVILYLTCLQTEKRVVNVATRVVVLTRVQGPEEDWEGKQQSCSDFGLQENKILLIQGMAYTDQN